ncbi:MAG: thiamine-phosphate kinase [Thermoanaerobaculia bacterium]
MRRTGEDSLLSWLRGRLATSSTGDGIGDDAAILPPLESSVVTMDSQIAGVHFPPDLAAGHLARRLLAVNLSDLAAMGATPAYAFLALSAAAGFDHKAFFVSFLAACRRFGLTLAGGDLARHPGGTIATLTLIGTKDQGARWLRRSGTEPGHVLWLGGTVGESAAGRILIERGARLAKGRVDLPAFCEAFSSPLRAAARRAVRRHLEPAPQLALGRWLGAQPAKITGISAIDISDGVARDLHRLCRESHVGAEIVVETLPFAAHFTELCKALGDVDPLALAFGGGEDYVLLFTLPPDLAPPPELGGRSIGTIVPRNRGGRSGPFMVHRGLRSKLPDAGWDHLSEE